jgi:hypothetical protein
LRQREGRRRGVLIAPILDSDRNSSGNGHPFTPVILSIAPPHWLYIDLLKANPGHGILLV